MTSNDLDYDPDDNFANSRQGAGGAVDDEQTAETLIWHVLLLINPGDEESALQQFGDWQERMRESADGHEALRALRDVIDWKSGFRVSLDEPEVLMEALDELASRVGLHIDWDVDDDEEEPDTDSASLIAQAHSRLRQDGYSLWTWCPRSESDEEIVSGWIIPRFEDQTLRDLCEALDIELRSGGSWA